VCSSDLQRDRFSHWLHYVGTFLFLGLPKLAMYHWKRGTKRMFWRLILGEAAFWSTCAVLFSFNPRATFVVFLLPVLVVRLLMMAGNWGQHAFIDPAAPGESWRSSITCINTPYNTRCFNDGFHTMHHKKPKMHWSEYPDLLATEPTRYGEQDALVFDGVDFFQVWALLMLGRHRELARRVVRLPGAPARTDEEMEAVLRQRLAPLPT
jgi:fatty acid desaturase